MLFHFIKVYFDESLRFYLNKQLHRLNGPALIAFDEEQDKHIITTNYQRYDKAHRINKPATKLWDYIDDINDVDRMFILYYVKYSVYDVKHRLHGAASIKWHNHISYNDLTYIMHELNVFSSKTLKKLDTGGFNNLNEYIKTITQIQNRLEKIVDEINVPLLSGSINNQFKDVKEIEYYKNGLPHRDGGPAKLQWNTIDYFHERDYDDVLNTLNEDDLSEAILDEELAYPIQEGQFEEGQFEEGQFEEGQFEEDLLDLQSTIDIKKFKKIHRLSYYNNGTLLKTYQR